jgi:hypothetical protein
MITGQLALSARRKIVAAPAPLKAWWSRLKMMGWWISYRPAGKTTSPPLAGNESSACWISAPVAPVDNGRTVGFAVEVSAAARRTARKTNITRHVIPFTATAPLTSWKLVFKTRESFAIVERVCTNYRPTAKKIHELFSII